MKKVKEMFEVYKTIKTADKHGRTFEQQKYRNDLAKSLTVMRKYGDTGQDLARDLLEKEKYTSQYFDALGSDRKLGMDIAIELIERGNIRILVDCLDKFIGLDHNYIAEKLIERDLQTFRFYLRKLEGVKLKYELVKNMFDEHSEQIVLSLDKFEGVDYNELARKLIDMDKNGGYKRDGGKYLLCTNLNKFNFLEYDILKSLIDIRDDFCPICLCITNLERFKGVDYNELAEILLDKGKYELLYKNINKFKGLDQKIMRRLFYDRWKHGFWVYGSSEFEITSDDIIGDLEIFHKLGGLTYTEMFCEVISRNKEQVRHRFPLCDASRKIINEVILKLGGGLLDAYLAKMLIKPENYNGRDYGICVDYGDIAIKNISKFKSSDHNEIAIEIIENGSKDTVSLFLKNIEKFEGLDYNEITKKLIKKGYGDFIARHPEKFGLKR